MGSYFSYIDVSSATTRLVAVHLGFGMAHTRANIDSEGQDEMFG